MLYFCGLVSIIKNYFTLCHWDFSNYYEHWAFLRDADRANTLTNMAAGTLVYAHQPVGLCPY